MYDAEDHRDGVEVVLAGGGAVDPVEDVEGAVGAQAEEVVGVYDGGDGGLAEKEELREDGDGFEDFGEGPEDLGCGLVQCLTSWWRDSLTSMNVNGCLHM